MQKTLLFTLAMLLKKVMQQGYYRIRTMTFLTILADGVSLVKLVVDLFRFSLAVDPKNLNLSRCFEKSDPTCLAVCGKDTFWAISKV